jgi:uroporphyrinogen III methyltransferase/synthase
MTKQGTIYLVGSGPGETNLITVKGMALVREADALVGDALAHARLLQAARPEAEIHDVGARSRGNKMPQDEVNQLLVGLARQGKTVVRLWQGDPFVFGRASREMLAAREAGLRVELVPGVTSAIAAPAYAGVPVTEWDYATAFAVVSGYESKTQNVRANWTALAGVETLVILMPLENLADIVGKLLAAGRAPDTPALVVEQGTWPQQRQVRATLSTVAEVVKAHRIQPRATLVVGRVVELASALDWFQPGEAYPLLGRRVLVTRPAHQAADFMAELRTLGAEPISFPTIAGADQRQRGGCLLGAIAATRAGQPRPGFGADCGHWPGHGRGAEPALDYPRFGAPGIYGGGGAGRFRPPGAGGGPTLFAGPGRYRPEDAGRGAGGPGRIGRRVTGLPDGAVGRRCPAAGG